MTRARRYDLFLPLRYNDGTPIEADKITQVRTTLTQRFPGLTRMPVALPGSEGVWIQFGRVYEDPIFIYMICVPATPANRSFFQQYKEILKTEFKQKEIFITEQAINIL